MTASKRRTKGFGSIRARKRQDGSIGYMLKVVIDGKDFVRTVSAPSIKDAKAQLPLFIAEIEGGEVARKKAEAARLSQMPTVAEYSETFMQSHVTLDEDRQATRTAYGDMLRLYILPPLKAKTLAGVTDGDLRDAFRAMFKEGYSISTIKLARIVANLFFEAAIEDGYLLKNPVPKFKKLKLGKASSGNSTKDKCLSREQSNALLAQCVDPQLHLFAAVQRFNGLRPGEAGALRWPHIDLSGLRIDVAGTVKRTRRTADSKGTSRIGKVKTDSSENWVPMDPVLVPLFTAERARQEAGQRRLRGLDANVRELRSLLPRNACVFPADCASEEGLCIPRPLSSLSTPFGAAATRAGLAKVTPHWLRHTFASIKLADGVALPVVSRMMRHANPGVTAKIYAHALPGWERDSSLFQQQAPAASATAEQIGAHKGQE